MVAVARTALAVAVTVLLVAVAEWWFDDPPRLPRVTDRRRELGEVAALAVLHVAVSVYAALADRGLAPAPGEVALDGRALNPAVVGAGVAVAALALGLEAGVRGRSLADLGLRRPVAWLPAAVLVAVGAGMGLSAVGRAAPVSGLALAVGLYDPAVEEEFLFRGVLQSKLERATTTTRAWVGGGLLFGLTHAPTDFLGAVWLSVGGDPLAAALLLAHQTAFGLLAGALYAKCRSLAAPVLAHFFANDLADVAATAGALP